MDGEGVFLLTENGHTVLTGKIYELVAPLINGENSEEVIIDQMGEFLFRSARVKTLQDRDPKRGRYYQSTTRPSPGGSAMHSLELYPVINECDGIDPGLYHYDPLDHELRLVSDPTKHTEKLLDQACMASVLQYEPGILLVIAARFHGNCI